MKPILFILFMFGSLCALQLTTKSTQPTNYAYSSVKYGAYNPVNGKVFCVNQLSNLADQATGIVISATRGVDINVTRVECVNDTTVIGKPNSKVLSGYGSASIMSISNNEIYINDFSSDKILIFSANKKPYAIQKVIDTEAGDTEGFYGRPSLVQDSLLWGDQPSSTIGSNNAGSLTKLRRVGRRQQIFAPFEIKTFEDISPYRNCFLELFDKYIIDKTISKGYRDMLESDLGGSVYKIMNYCPGPNNNTLAINSFGTQLHLLNHNADMLRTYPVTTFAQMRQQDIKHFINDENRPTAFDGLTRLTSCLYLPATNTALLVYTLKGLALQKLGTEQAVISVNLDTGVCSEPVAFDGKIFGVKNDSTILAWVNINDDATIAEIEVQP